MLDIMISISTFLLLQRKKYNLVCSKPTDHFCFIHEQNQFIMRLTIYAIANEITLNDRSSDITCLFKKVESVLISEQTGAQRAAFVQGLNQTNIYLFSIPSLGPVLLSWSRGPILENIFVLVLLKSMNDKNIIYLFL